MGTEPELVTIASDELLATISSMGAELQSIDDAHGNTYLWNGDPAWWSGRAPILFPIVGALANDTHRVGETTYTMTKHGFARRSRFEVITQAADRVTFRLTESAATLAQYPYRFCLDITFHIEGTTLSTSAIVRNSDSQPIPVSFGFHPAFLWPLPGAGQSEAQAVTFEYDETEPASRINASGLVDRTEPESRIRDRQLKLSPDLFDDDALLYLSPSSRRVWFGAANGQGTHLDVQFPDMPQLGIWTKPGGAPYLCIEPWYGYASPADFAGSLMDKPGTAILAIGEDKEFAMSVTVVR